MINQVRQNETKPLFKPIRYEKQPYSLMYIFIFEMRLTKLSFNRHCVHFGQFNLMKLVNSTVVMPLSTSKYLMLYITHVLSE